LPVLQAGLVYGLIPLVLLYVFGLLAKDLLRRNKSAL